MNLQPVQQGERISSMDILRGFSLLGILLVNIIAFYVPMPHVSDLPNWFTDVNDIIFHQYLDIYVQSSFYPLFSMLFGYGIAMQFIKAKEASVSFYKFAAKRLILLFVLGMLHAYLIWWGDILATYAFCGFFLMIFIWLSAKWLFILAIVINGLLQFLVISNFSLSGVMHTEVESGALDLIAVQNAITAYTSGSWSDAFVQRLVDLSIQFEPDMWISSLFTILPYMLLGAAASKLKLIERAKQYWKMWLVIAVIGIALGLFIKNAPILYTRTYFLDYAKVFIGGPILAVGYIGFVVSLCQFRKVVRFLSPVAKLGRMSLTAYLMQSIILSVLFYNWGYGLYGEIDVLMGIYIAIEIYIVQLIIAELWFIKFKQGPIEWGMKEIIYSKKLSEK